MRRVAVAVATLSCTALACAPAANTTSFAAGEPCYTGTVAFDGVEGVGRTVLRHDGRHLVDLHGAGAAAVLQLSGALVTVCGPAAGADRAGIAVAGFELRQVDGMQAYYGTVRVAHGRVLLESGGRPPVPLGDVPDALRAAHGRDAWVAGAWHGAFFAVRSYGLAAAQRP
jgi:hypothetical protein